jgi:hypothetical protein
MSDKQTVLQEIDQAYQELLQAVDKLDNQQLARVWYGTWGVKDIIAHILGWQREMTPALERLARGERPTPEGVDYSDIDGWNAKFALEFAPIDGSTVIATWRQVHMNYVKAVRQVPEDRFGTDEQGNPKTATRLCQLTSYGHFREHAQAIREWREREGI